MFSYKNIYTSYMECRKNKRNTHNALAFEVDLVQNLWKLHDDLNQNRYVIGKSICFLTNSPKLREVFAADFRDRIVHHILVRELEKCYEKRFIHDVYNNRKNRGIHNAMKQAQKYMHQTTNGYYLQLDIKGFFYNLDKNILFKKIFSDISLACGFVRIPKPELGNKSAGETVKELLLSEAMALPSLKRSPKSSSFKALSTEGRAIGSKENEFFHSLCDFGLHTRETLYLVNKIIYHDPTRNYIFKGDKTKLELLPPHKTLFKIPKHKGMPIGNLTSQFFANVYMSNFDNYVKRVLKVKHYIRYVDDFVLFDTSKERLLMLKKEIEHYLKQNFFSVIANAFFVIANEVKQSKKLLTKDCFVPRNDRVCASQ